MQVPLMLPSFLYLHLIHTKIVSFYTSSSSSAFVLSALEEEARRFHRSNINFNDDRNCFPDVLKEVSALWFIVIFDLK